MVKRIKKRIEKEESDPADVDGAIEDEAPIGEGGLAAELAAADDDEFTRKTASVLQWIADRRALVLGGVAVAIIGVGVYAYTHRQKAAGSEEATASFMKGADAYQKYIEGIVGQGPEGAPADDLPARLEKARTAFADTQRDYPASGLSKLAAVGLAGSELELGKFDEALKNYEQVTASGETDVLVMAVALQGKAAALDSKGDKAGAIAAWTALGALNPTVFGLSSQIEIARLQESMGQLDKAKATYEKIQKDFKEALEGFGNRGYKSEIERSLARLGQAS